jgi:ADP-glucose pyrophosphorylase
VLGIILGGGAGTRLYPLTKKRAKPAVPLGANYRLIDIPVSNCVNSNVTKIYCLTQFNSASLNRHLSQAYVSMRQWAAECGCVWVCVGVCVGGGGEGVSRGRRTR